MIERKLLQYSFPMRRQIKQHFTAIFCCPLTAHEPSCLKSIDQFHSAMVLNLQPIGNFHDPRTNATRKPFEGEQQLMLLWLQACAARRLFAEVNESPYQPAKFGQGLI